MKIKIVESSLMRLHSKMKEHNCGFISACRSEYSSEENQLRNKKLRSQLIYKGYRITAIKGGFIENFRSVTKEETIVTENSYFVEDYNNKHDLLGDLKELGEEWNQDSIIYITKKDGGIISQEWSTNKDNDYIPYGTFIERGKLEYGKPFQFMTTIHNRPLVFKESKEVYSICDSPIIATDVEKTYNPSGLAGRFAAYRYAQKPWDETLKEK